MIPTLWRGLRKGNKRLFSVQQALDRQLIIHLLSMPQRLRGLGRDVDA
jgi:hypothetical protein